MPNPDESLPLISIVIPAYNAQKYLALTIKSVKNQTFQGWECVIVDDGSNDATAQIAREIAEKDARFRFFGQPNGGVSRARNFGLEKSNSNTKFVAFLDSDDLWEPDFLQILLETLENQPDAPAAHCIASTINANGQKINVGLLENDGRQRYRLQGQRIVRDFNGEATNFSMTAVHHTITTPGCVLIRRAALQKVGGFNTNFQVGEDWDLWVRLSRLGDLPLVNQPLLAYRRHQSNSSSNRALAAQNRQVRRLIIQSPDNTPQQRQIALTAYRAFYWYLARDRFQKVGKHLKKRAWKQAGQFLVLALVNGAMGLKGRP